MELRHLEYFLAIAREGSFLKAAEKLHITQPTLSRQIKEIEDEIGKPLFIRGNRHVTLTDEGLFLKHRATEILSLYQKTASELMSQDYELTGELSIGAGESYGFSIIGKALKQFKVLHPKVKINIYSGDYDDLLYQLEHGLIDFALLITNSQLEKQYQFLTLPYKDKAGLLIRKDDPLSNKEYITRDELRHLPIFISRQPSSQYMLQDWFNLHMDELNVIGTYNLLYNASLLVKEKVGYSFALENLVDVSESSNLCFRPFMPELSAKLILIWKQHLIQSKPAQIFIDILNQTIKESILD